MGFLLQLPKVRCSLGRNSALILHQSAIDYTAGPGYLTQACISNKVPDVGVVQTEKHEAVVKQYFNKKVWDMMHTEGNSNYDPGLAACDQAARP